MIKSILSLSLVVQIAGKSLAWPGLERELQELRVSLLQPKVTVVESQPQRNVFGSISLPEGSPWCDGNMTFWLVGHHLNETPHCYDAELDTWTTPEIAMMDLNDELNDLDARPPHIDRHDCSTLDVNKDGLPDIVCAVGADKGEGQGYNELYLTQEDGSLQKVKYHGLQKYNTVRTRFVETLHNRVDEGNITHVFVSAFGSGRHDGNVNWHTMHRLIEGEPYFEEVLGPWNKHAKARQLSVVDWNQDGRDDIIVMHNRNWTMFFEQEEGGTFREIVYPRSYMNNRIRSARVADVDLDGIPDLIVTTARFKNMAKEWQPPTLKIFKGIDSPDRFDFSGFYFRMFLPFSAPDIEVLDVNSDGIPDIYVVLQDDAKESFCGHQMPWRLKPYPPPNWTAPLDVARDFLLLGKGFQTNEADRFEKVVMDHTLPGCGFIAKIFGNNKTMILANGDEGHPGSNAILSWW